MKIADITHAKPVQQVEKWGNDQAGIPLKPTAKKLDQGDIVELSAALDQELSVQQEENQARRVAEIKSQIAAGTYQVNSSAVAEKMLSETSGI